MIIIYIIEKKDWECDNAYAWWDKCHEAEGMPYRGSKPKETDDCFTLLKKIDIAARTEQETIKWRRALSLAILISFLVFTLIITPGKLPGEWPKFILVILVIWSILYFNFNNYAYHKYRSPQQNIEKSTELLKKYCSS